MVVCRRPCGSISSKKALDGVGVAVKVMDVAVVDVDMQLETLSAAVVGIDPYNSKPLGQPVN